MSVNAMPHTIVYNNFIRMGKISKKVKKEENLCTICMTR